MKTTVSNTLLAQNVWISNPHQVSWEAIQTVVGAMFQSNTRMDQMEPDVLISRTNHGTVVINTIPPHALQDGLVMKQPTNVSWQSQEMDLEVKQLAKNIAVPLFLIQPNIDAILLNTFASNVQMEMRDVTLIDLLHATIVRTQIQTQAKRSKSATRLIQNIQNALTAKKVKPVAKKEANAVNNVMKSKNSTNVIPRLSLVSRPNNKVTSRKPVLLSVDISLHKSSSVPGEVLWPRMESQTILIWERST